MRFGVLGTGRVGQTLGSRLLEIGHEVTLGGRAAGGERAAEWAARAPHGAREGTFADAAAFGEVVVNATAGTHSLEALAAVAAGDLDDKVLIDVANPLDFSKGMPPRLSVCNDDSLAEQIQRAYPRARVVKALNTVTADVMVQPGLLPGPHTLFICGDDAAAKAQVAEVLTTFGWGSGDLLDLGDITAARGMEMYLPLWVRLWSAVGTPRFNVRVVNA